MLKDKYTLTNIKVYPTCAPLSTERILLLSGSKYEQILECLTEIYLNMCQTPTQQATFLYSPEFYDVTLADDYGGFVDRQLQLAMQRSITAAANTNNQNDEEELSGYEDEDVEDFDNDTNNYQTRRPMSIRGTKAEIEHATKLILETIKRHDRKLPLRHNHKRGK
jgi:hypothetical protein